MTTFKIFLDSGHGGKDGGAQGNGLSEKVLTLLLAQKIKKELGKYQNVEVEMSRYTDKYVDLSERADMANKWKADAFISLHINSATTTSASGFETYIYNDTVNAKTQAFQNVVHEELKKQIDMRDRGKKRANFAVLRQTNMSALLTENGFIVNTSDASKLKEDAYLNRIALGHVNGIVKFFGLKKEVEAVAPPTSSSGNTIQKPSKGKLYKVQVGAFAEQQNAIDLAKKLEKSGYKPYISEE